MAGGFRESERFRDSESPSHRLTAATALFNKGAFGASNARQKRAARPVVGPYMVRRP